MIFFIYAKKNKKHQCLWAVISILFISLGGNITQAQWLEKSIVPKVRSIAQEASKETKVKGWSPKLTLGLNISLDSSDHVVGQLNGESNTFGLKIDGGYDFYSERNEWRNTFNLQESTSKTPTLPRYVKANDELSLKSMYLRHLESYNWLGPYVKAELKAPLFVGEDIRSDSSNVYSIKRPQGIETVSSTSLRLTRGLRPLTTNEAVGFFAQVIEKEHHHLEFRLGVGAQQVLADDQLVVKDVKDTSVIEVEELSSFSQVGVELGMEWKGDIDEKTSYSLTYESLTPVGVSTNEGDPCSSCSGLELTNIEVKFKMEVKLYEWLVADYEFKLKRQPKLLNESQVQHMFLLNLNYVLL